MSTLYYKLDHCLYILHAKVEILDISLYVDDLVVTISDIDLILGLRKEIKVTIDPTKLGPSHFFLDVQFLKMDDVSSKSPLLSSKMPPRIP